MNTKAALMNEMERSGLSFTANVIMNGCSKPVTKMKTVCELLRRGIDVRPVGFSCYSLLVDNHHISFSDLDRGADHIQNFMGIVSHK